MLRSLHKILPKFFFRLRYLGQPPWDSGITPPELVEFIETHPPGRALDLGCGTGTNVITLAQHGWQTHGVDFVPKAIRQAKRKARRAGITASFEVGDVTNLSHLPNQYDLIVDIGCYHSVPLANRPAYQANIARLLAPGGTFMIYAFQQTEPITPPGFGPRDQSTFEDILTLDRKELGEDRGFRQSAWLWFKQDAA